MTLYFWNVLMCVLPIVAVAVVGMTKYRLNPLYSLLILFGSGFFLTTYLTSIFQLVSLPLSRAIRWKGRGYEYDKQSKELRSKWYITVLSSDRCNMDYIFPIEFKKCEKMNLLIQVIVSMSQAQTSFIVRFLNPSLQLSHVNEDLGKQN